MSFSCHAKLQPVEPSRALKLKIKSKACLKCHSWRHEAVREEKQEAGPEQTRPRTMETIRSATEIRHRSASVSEQRWYNKQSARDLQQENQSRTVTKIMVTPNTHTSRPCSHSASPSAVESGI